MCEQKDMSQPKEVEETSPSKAVEKRPLAPPDFEKLEVCKKMRAEAKSPNTDHLQFIQDLFTEVNTEDKEQLKRTVGFFWEITNNFLAMGRKNAELLQEVEAAKVVAESAVKKANESDSRAEKAEKAEKAMASKIAELYEVAKKEVAAAKLVAENALKKVKDLDNRAEKAEKEVAAAKAVAENAVQKAKDADKRAAFQEMSFIQIKNNYLTMLFKNAELHRDVEVAKKELAAVKVKAEESGKRAEKAEKALKDVKIAFKNYSESAIGGIGKALQDFENAVARA